MFGGVAGMGVRVDSDGATHTLLTPDRWRDYALLDSGLGWKLEQVGPYRFARPDSQALWRPRAALETWRPDARFSPAADEDDERGRWRFERDIPERWEMAYGDVRFYARCTPFRHLGFFPEQGVHWEWARARLRPGDTVLNLFGYTGLASLIAAAGGAHVTHVDASKKAIGFGRENQALSGLTEAPIRWIADDALAFTQREARRGRRYNLVILDPPKFGRGPEGEVWSFEEGLAELLGAVRAVLAEPPAPAALVLTAYALRLSHHALARATAQALAGAGLELHHGDMGLAEAGKPDQPSRGVLPCALYVRGARPSA
jgi:23S rRNA (cytosine1962-C5)-methyltransferase